MIDAISHPVDRPAVSVVMPFSGDADAGRVAVQTLRSLVTRPGDELILADNSGLAGSVGDVDSAAVAGCVEGADSAAVARPVEDVAVVHASGERSPAYARNAGASHAHCDWILFLDADCRVPSGLLDAYFNEPVAAGVGALAGEVAPCPGGDTLAARYGAARNFLSQEAHLAHPYRPRAVAANLLVRRAAFEQVGGFYEGVRAAEDTDLSWRIQQAGWRLELRSQARVEHRYRATVGELRRQWRGYAAGRAWLGRRYEGFVPEPAVRRAARRAWRLLRRRRGGWVASPPPPAGGGGPAGRAAAGGAPAGRAPADRPAAQRVAVGRLERGRYLALDAVLAAEELAGLALSNRPVAARDRTRRRRLRRAGRRNETRRARSHAHIVLVTDRFPVRLDPLTELACTIEGARVEAAARPPAVDVQTARALRVDYREDDGIAERASALAVQVIRHPVRCAVDRARRRRGGPSLAALAPAVRRLQRDRHARVHPLGQGEALVTAQRLSALAGGRLNASS